VVFTSTVFLFLFLPIALLTYYVFPRKLRAVPLLVLSALFYSWGEPVLVILILVSSLLNFMFGRLLARSPGGRSKAPLIAGIVVNLLPLLVFKYLHFLLGVVGLSSLASEVHLRLPIGVSFYTFIAISYLADIYRGRNVGAPSLLTFAAYLTMFPHLVAGPIVRWGQVGPQLLRPRFDPGLFGYGAIRVAQGLVKKAVLADSLSPMVDSMFATGAPTSWGSAWIAALLYSLQIFLDFSGYSDIAIGLAAMLGVRFEENFRYPYIAKSAREFWHRWHISLGSWFRDYVYIPLGGSRVGPVLLWRNLLVVWALTGLWHGAAWTFVLWGMYFGVLIGLERGSFGRAVERLPVVAQHLYGVLVAVLGWVMFRSESLPQAIDYYRTMFGFGGVSWWDDRASYVIAQTFVVALISTIIATSAGRRLNEVTERFFTGHLEPDPWSGGEGHRPTTALAPVEYAGQVQPGAVATLEPSEVGDRVRDRHEVSWSVVAAVSVSLLLLIGASFVVSVTYSPFIYFRF